MSQTTVALKVPPDISSESQAFQFCAPSGDLSQVGWLGEGVREVEVVGMVWKEQRAERGLHHWMRCFYPGNVICLNALCAPGARPAAVLIFLRLCCQKEPGYLWESSTAGSSRPHPGIWTRPLQFIVGQSLWNLWTQCVVKVNTVSAQVNSDGSVASLHGSRGRES